MSYRTELAFQYACRAKRAELNRELELLSAMHKSSIEYGKPEEAARFETEFFELTERLASPHWRHDDWRELDMESKLS